MDIRIGTPAIPSIGTLQGPAAVRSSEAADQPSFADTLKAFVAEANTLQSEADRLTARLASGQPVDLHDVVIATEKAALALDLVIQVRNKAIEAYQEIMRIQV